MPRGYHEDGSHAGGSPKSDKIKYGFKLDPQHYAWMKENLQPGTYSDFINAAIASEIKKSSRKSYRAS